MCKAPELRISTVDTLLSRITIDPNIYHSQPVIRGLRYREEEE